MKIKTKFSDLYSFPGFRAKTRFQSGVKGDPKARVVTLVRRQKKRDVPDAAKDQAAITIKRAIEYGTWMLVGCEFIWSLNTGGWIAGDARA